MVLRLKNIATFDNAGHGVFIGKGAEVEMDGLYSEGNGGDALHVEGASSEDKVKEVQKKRPRKYWSGWTLPLIVGLVTTVGGGYILYAFGWN